MPVAALSDETLLLADQDRAPEFNEFVAEVCRTAGFFPALFHGSVQNLRAAVDLVVRGPLRAVPAGVGGAVVARRDVAAARTARTPLSLVDPVARRRTRPATPCRWSRPPAGCASRTAGARAPAEIAS